MTADAKGASAPSTGAKTAKIAKTAKKLEIVYASADKIPDTNYWFHPPVKGKDPNFVVKMTITTRTGESAPYAVKINGTDRRGLRMIGFLCYYDRKDMEPRLDRQALAEENSQLADLGGFMKTVVEAMGYTFQRSLAANLGMSLDVTGEKIVLGTSSEPLGPHEHYMLRTDVGALLPGGLVYEGPILGDEFLLKGPKVGWNLDFETMTAASKSIAEGIRKMAHKAPMFGISELVVA